MLARQRFSSYTKVYSVIYDSGSVLQRANFSPRDTRACAMRVDMLTTNGVRVSILTAFHESSRKQRKSWQHCGITMTTFRVSGPTWRDDALIVN